MARRPVPEILGSMLTRSVTVGTLGAQHGTRNTRSPVRAGLDRKVTVDLGATMLHETQADALAAIGRRLHADAGVLHFQQQSPIYLLQTDPDGARLGMTGGVAECFLGDAVEVR